MNIAGHVKSINRNSKCVVNLNIDFPIDSKKLVIRKPICGQFTIQPNSYKNNIKLKINSVRANPYQKNKNIVLNNDQEGVNSARIQKRTTNKSSLKNSSNPTRHSKHASFCHSKSPSRIIKNNNKDNISLFQTLNYSTINNKIFDSVQDQIIGYTNPSVELKKQKRGANNNQINNNKNDYLVRMPLVTPPLKKFQKNQTQNSELISQIVKVEKNAKEKKKEINICYILQKVKMKVCARKIQRAWRNYKTKKLIHAYSQSLSIKLTNKMKNNLFQKKQKILNVKSCGLSNNKNQMKMNIKQSKQYGFENKTKKKVSVQEQIVKNMQIQQIKKWQELIQQLRKNKDVDHVLEIAKKQKQHYGDKQQTNKQQLSLKNTIGKIEDQNTRRQIQQKISILDKSSAGPSINACIMNSIKINTFQQKQISQLQHIIGQQNPISPRSFQKQVKIDYSVCKQVKQQFLSLFGKNNLNQQQNEQKNQEKQQTIIQQKKIQARQIQKQQDEAGNKNIQLSVNKNNKISLREFNNVSDQKTNQNFKIRLLTQFLSKIQGQNQIQVQQQVLNITEHVLAVFLTDLLTEIAQSNILRHLNKKLKKLTKLQGICTSLQSIKDYLQNLISYIFDQYPRIFIQQFNRFQILSPISILKSIRKNSIHSVESREIELFLPKQLFHRHWQQAERQIYFQKKYLDEQQQKQRVRRLKQITKIFFQSIFDSFSYCLDLERSRDQLKILPWQKRPHHKNKLVSDLQMTKPKIKTAFKILTQMTTIFCGLLIQDKRTNFSKQVLGRQLQISLQIKQQRMVVYLQYEMKTMNNAWQNYAIQKTEILINISNFIFDQIISQFCRLLKASKNQFQLKPTFLLFQ